MRKLSAMVLALVLAITTVACGSAKEKELIPLEELPSDYSLEDAKRDGCVTFEDGDVSYGEDIWEQFVGAVNSEKSASVRLASYYTLDPDQCDPEYYESAKDEYPKLFIQDLTYDGQGYTIRWFEDGEEIVREYKYMMKYEGEAETETAIFESYERYVLINDNTVTWEDILHGLASSQLGDYIEHLSVYCDLVMK